MLVIHTVVLSQARQSRNMFTYYIITLIITIIYLVWRLGTRNFWYWKIKGVKHEKPVFFFGNMYNQFMRRKSFSQQIEEWYENFPEEKYVGVHMANDLGLVLRDPELIKRVLLTDFKHFYQRGVHSHKHVKEPLYQNMFAADGDIWKLVRQQLTPAFSSGKIKAMFPLIVRTAEKMLSVVEEGTQDVRELMARYTTDFIGICGFGLEFDSLNDESSLFRRLGKRVLEITTRDTIIHVIKRIAPELFKNLNYLAPEIEDKTVRIVKQIINQRNHVPSGRNDFIDLLLEVKQKGKVVGQSLEHFNPDGTAKTIQLELDDMLIVAQVFIFFLAGYETSASGTSFLLHELAFNPEVQQRCQDEIDEVLKRHSGKLSYIAVKEMKYLEMALMEAIRLHPSPGFLMRKCAKKYTFPETGLTIDEDVFILLSLAALHKDPKFFKDPEVFRPERFLPNEIEKVQKFVFMPFGEGPRACVGERLGLMQSLAGVSALLSRFSVKPAPTSRRHPVIDPRSFVTENILGGLPLTIVRREKTNGFTEHRA